MLTDALQEIQEASEEKEEDDEEEEEEDQASGDDDSARVKDMGMTALEAAEHASQTGMLAGTRIRVPVCTCMYLYVPVCTCMYP